jgi:hypothetical protein
MKALFFRLEEGRFAVRVIPGRRVSFFVPFHAHVTASHTEFRK